MRNIHFALFTTCFLFTFLCLAANSAQTQPHLNGVTSFAAASDGSAYSAGKDGFVIKWTQNGGEPWQFTTLAVKFIAVHPTNGDIALYETDGFAVHRVSVWNWAQKSRKYVKILSGEIMCLTYTARGSYLILGTVSLQGATFLNAHTGAQVSLLSGTSGTVSFATSNQSESNLVLYTATGMLSYYDLRSKKIKASFQTETNLKNIVLYKNNLILAGYKDNAVYTIDALSGKVLKKIAAQDAAITVHESDSFLSYFAYNPAGIYTKYRETEDSITEVEAGISGTVSAVFKTTSGIFLGMNDGNVFFETATTLMLTKLTHKTRKPILDINIHNGTAYFITADAYYQAELKTSNVRRLASIQGFATVTPCSNGAILWSKGERTSFTYIPNDNLFLREILYTPKAAIQSAAVYGNMLVFVEGNGFAGVYNLETRTLEGSYTGSGFQSAAIVSDTLYIAKSAATNPKTPLISISLKTGETAAELKTTTGGEAAYALTAEGNTLYGILSRVSPTDKKTELFSYTTNLRRSRAVLTFADEDLDANMALHKGVLYTNLGKTQISIVDLVRNTVQRLPRIAVLPQKATPSDEYIVLLNTNGTVAVYTNQPYTFITNWAVLENGECVTY